jgi:hypothetical protein
MPHAMPASVGRTKKKRPFKELSRKNNVTAPHHEDADEE